MENAFNICKVFTEDMTVRDKKWCTNALKGMKFCEELNDNARFLKIKEVMYSYNGNYLFIYDFVNKHSVVTNIYADLEQEIQQIKENGTPKEVSGFTGGRLAKFTVNNTDFRIFKNRAFAVKTANVIRRMQIPNPVCVVIYCIPEGKNKYPFYAVSRLKQRPGINPRWPFLMKNVPLDHEMNSCVSCKTKYSVKGEFFKILHLNPTKDLQLRFSHTTPIRIAGPLVYCGDFDTLSAATIISLEWSNANKPIRKEFSTEYTLNRSPTVRITLHRSLEDKVIGELRIAMEGKLGALAAIEEYAAAKPQNGKCHVCLSPSKYRCICRICYCCVACQKKDRIVHKYWCPIIANINGLSNDVDGDPRVLIENLSGAPIAQSMMNKFMREVEMIDDLSNILNK